MIRAILAGLLLAMVPLTSASAQNWNTTYKRTERGHLLGNPDAKTKLIAFISYSCPHCKEFEYQADAPLRLQYIQTGKVSFEVRPVMRNVLDMAAGLIAQCGPEDKFWGNYRAIFYAQDKWLPIAINETPAQTQRWMTGSLGARMEAVASDLHFYSLMEPRGYSVGQLNQCLSNEAAAKKLVADSEADSKQFDIPGTPSFAIDGKSLPGVHSWEALKPILAASTAAASKTSSN